MWEQTHGFHVYIYSYKQCYRVIEYIGPKNGLCVAKHARLVQSVSPVVITSAQYSSEPTRIASSCCKCICCGHVTHVAQPHGEPMQAMAQYGTTLEVLATAYTATLRCMYDDLPGYALMRMIKSP